MSYICYTLYILYHEKKIHEKNAWNITWKFLENLFTKIDLLTVIHPTLRILFYSLKHVT